MLTLGVDLLATQYAGYRSYAAIQAIRGDEAAAQMYLGRAAECEGIDQYEMVEPQWRIFLRISR